MMVFLSTILSGLTYGPVSLMFRFMNVVVGAPTSFYQTQRVYGQAIHKFYQQQISTKLHAALSQKDQGVRLLIDTRFDTPGMPMPTHIFSIHITFIFTFVSYETIGCLLYV